VLNNPDQNDLKSLLAMIVNIRSEAEAQDFLANYFSYAELEKLVQRVGIFRMLKAKIPQREIAAQLKVGIATVTRGAQQLKNDSTNNWWRDFRSWRR